MSQEWAIVSALWLGLLTSLSPCPLAGNLAAISVLGRQAGHPRQLFVAGAGYTLGRTLAYWLISVVVLTGLLAGGELSRFLQRYLNQLLGPLLILSGMLLLEWLGLPFSLRLGHERLQALAAKGGWGGAFLLGALLALAFCPVSAGLFFGGLLPLALQAESRLLLPILFGVGTALPVILFAALLAGAARQVSRWFNAVSVIEPAVRRLTAAALILAGFHYCLRHIYQLW